MGIAAYQRGTLAIRDQIDREVEAKRPQIERRELAARLSELQAELRLVRQQRDRLAGLLTKQRAATLAAANRHKAKVANLRGWVSRLHEAVVLARKQWHYASWIIRNTLSPEAYHRAREEWEREHGKPAL